MDQMNFIVNGPDGYRFDGSNYHPYMYPGQAAEAGE